MSESEETHVKSVTRNSFPDRRPIGYVTIIQEVDEKTFQRLKYVDSRQEYVVERHSTRDIGCQMNTKYEILLSSRKVPQTPTRPSSPPPSPPPSTSPSKCDVGCQMTTDYVILLSKPRSPPPSPSPPPTPPPPPTPTIPTKEEQFVYYIDLRQHVEIIGPKPFEIEPRILPKQKVKKKKVDDYIVTVGGGWNKMDDFTERHEPVKTFVYEIEQLKNTNLPGKKRVLWIPIPL